MTEEPKEDKPKKILEIKQATEEEITELATGFLEHKWHPMQNEEQIRNDAMAMMILSKLSEEYDFTNGPPFVPWGKSDGMFTTTLRLVSPDDHNKIVKRIKNAMRVAKGEPLE